MSAAFTRLAREVRNRFETQPLVRAINFHNTARTNKDVFANQFEICATHFSTVTEDDLDRYLAAGDWHKPKPGVLLAFYEGYRNNFDVIVPLLEQFGLTGWFFVITGFIDCPVEDQLVYVEPHGIGMSTREYPDGRYAMSWDELRQIDSRHVVASHAMSHWDISTMAAAEQRAEIVGTQSSFVQHLDHPVRTFVSRGGPAYGDHPAMDALIDEAGYQFVVSGYRIQRLRDRQTA